MNTSGRERERDDWMTVCPHVTQQNNACSTRHCLYIFALFFFVASPIHSFIHSFCTSFPSLKNSISLDFKFNDFHLTLHFTDYRWILLCRILDTKIFYFSLSLPRSFAYSVCIFHLNSAFLQSLLLALFYSHFQLDFSLFVIYRKDYIKSLLIILFFPFSPSLFKVIWRWKMYRKAKTTWQLTNGFN